MTIASFAFLAFSLIVVLAYNLHPGVVWRKWVLLIANLFFLSTFSHDPVSFIPFASFLLFGYLSVRAMQHSHDQSAYYWILAGMLLAFFWLKNMQFCPNSPSCVLRIPCWACPIYLLSCNASDH
jgi:alginate O-acetyltransferase complex protein AlgI